MNKLDEELLSAWMSIGAFAGASPRQALHRARRTFGTVYQRPMRAWCLALRASDTRISPRNAIILPLPGEMIGLDDDPFDLVRTYRPHTVTLCGSTIRELTKPVIIPRPGLTIAQAAQRLGLTRNHLNAWIAAGTVRVSHYERGRSGRGCGGKPRPMVYTPSPLDPNRGAGRPPNPVWGTLWQSHWKDMPEHYQQTFVRTPRLKIINGRRRFNGWEWRCAGRRNSDINRGICARACSILYLPLQPWTIGRSGFAPLQLTLPDGCGLAGTWHPGESNHPRSNSSSLNESFDPQLDAPNDAPPEVLPQAFPDAHGESSHDSSYASSTSNASAEGVHRLPPRASTPMFKCYHCWEVRGCAMANRHGWHDFVTVISGGLLHGSEVERPKSEAPRIRRRRSYTHAPRKTPKRDLVLEGILRGERYKQIAARSGMTYQAVLCQAALLFKLNGVHSREELIDKLRATKVPQALTG